jgi:peroxiredoxin
MEDMTMRRFVISATVVLAVLMLAWTVFAQEQGGGVREMRGRAADANLPAGEGRAARTLGIGREGAGPFEGLSPDEKARIREKWEQMSDEEREKFRTQMRERIGTRRPLLGREEQLKIVAVIEQQVAKLKELIQAPVGPDDWAKLRDLAAEERTKMRVKLARANEERQRVVDAIEQQLANFKIERPQIGDHQKLITELQAIHDLAKQEKAQETANRIEQLIESREKEFEEKLRAASESRPMIPRNEPTILKNERTESESGKKAPDFTIKSFDGKTVKLADYKGKIVVLEWFNFECPYCMSHYGQKKTMVELANKYKDKNVVWLAVNSTSHITVEKNKEFVAQQKLPYPILDDRAGVVGRAYGAQTTPHIFIISPAGNIVYNGAIDNAPMGKTPEGEAYVNYVDKALAELAAGKAVTTANTKPYGCTVKYPR